jgi:hypothetical protein
MSDQRLPPLCGERPAAAQRQNKKSPSFLKKRSKRLLFPRRPPDRGPNAQGMGLDLSAGARIKVFLLLFLQKKKAFLSKYLQEGTRFAQ